MIRSIRRCLSSATRHGDGEVGLAGAGRAEREDQVVAVERAQVGRLVGRARRDQLALGPDGAVLAEHAAALRARPAPCASVASTSSRPDDAAALELAVEILEHGRGDA